MFEWTLMKRLIWIKAAVISGAASLYETISGAIVSFVALHAKALKKLVVNIEPVQDLHGYAAPWPGGAGKNKLKNLQTTQTISGVTFTVYDDGSVLVNGTATDTIVFSLNAELQDYLVHAEQYILNGSPTNDDPTKWKFRVYNGTSDYIDIGSGISFTFNNLSASRKCDIVVYSGTQMNNVLIKPMIRLATVADATFAPYANECPISGWTGVQAWTAGINVWDEQWEPGLISASDGQDTPSASYCRTKNYLRLKASTEYYFKLPEGLILYLRLYDVKKNYLGYSQINNSRAINISTIYLNAAYLRFCWDGQTYGNNISINYPATDHDYHAYSGQSYSVTWQDEVFGGNHDIISGAMQETWASAILDGSQEIGVANWRPIAGSSAWLYNLAALPSVANGLQGDVIADKLPPVAYSQIYAGSIGVATVEDSFYYGIAVRVPVEGLTTKEAINAYLAQNPIQIAYKLATPVTSQSSPQEVTTLLGQNNIWADAGDVEVTYYAK